MNPLTAGPGSLIGADGQAQWGDLLMGLGTPFHVASEGFTGWFDLPELDSSDAPRPWQHGAWTGARWAQPRVVGASVWLVGDDRAHTARVLDEFARATTPDGGEQWLAVRTHGRTYVVKARLLQRVLPTDRQLLLGNATKATIQWICADPHRYEQHEQIATTPLPQRGPGMAYPLAYPTDYGVASVTGSVVPVNAGNTPAWSVLTVTGPVAQPRIVNQTTGAYLEYDLVLDAGEQLTIDTSEGTVELDGGSSRLHTATAHSMPEQAWTLVPGTNQIDFRADSNTPDARLSIAWRSAFL
jgi:hypothetical protein